MSRGTSFLTRRTWWVAAVALVALAFWVVAFGVGWRAWILTGPRPGIVAHTAEAGLAAAPWMTVAATLTLMTAVMGVGLALVRHLVDGPVEVDEPLEELPELEPREPLPELGAADGS
jgi:hypothetical protein